MYHHFILHFYNLDTPRNYFYLYIKSSVLLSESENMERIVRKDYTPKDANIRHLIIGHSQIRNCWECKYEEEELNFNMDWISVSEGKAQELKELLIQELRESQIPLRISAIIWQNSIPSISYTEVEQIIEDIEKALDQYPQHKVALPECQFVPAQAIHFEHISKINLILADFNKRQGFNSYHLHKAVMRQRKGSLAVKQSEWLEFQNKTGPGYHIADKTKYTKFIRKFHLSNLQNAKDVFWTPSRLDITKVMAVISPPARMVDPSEAQEDLRETLNVNKQLASGKRPRSPEKIEEKPAETEVKSEDVPQQDVPQQTTRPRKSKRPKMGDMKIIIRNWGPMKAMTPQLKAVSNRISEALNSDACPKASTSTNVDEKDGLSTDEEKSIAKSCLKKFKKRIKERMIKKLKRKEKERRKDKKKYKKKKSKKKEDEKSRKKKKSMRDNSSDSSSSSDSSTDSSTDSSSSSDSSD